MVGTSSVKLGQLKIGIISPGLFLSSSAWFLQIYGSLDLFWEFYFFQPNKKITTRILCMKIIRDFIKYSSTTCFHPKNIHSLQISTFTCNLRWHRLPCHGLGLNSQFRLHSELVCMVLVTVICSDGSQHWNSETVSPIKLQFVVLNHLC